MSPYWGQEYITLKQRSTTPRIGSRNIKIKIGGDGLPRKYLLLL